MGGGVEEVILKVIGKKKRKYNTQGKPKAVMGRFFFPFAGQDISH